MTFIRTAVASVTLYAISGSVFATTYFSMQEKADAIQHVRDEANAANSRYELTIQKFNQDRAHFTQQDMAISEQALETLKNAGARISEIQQTPLKLNGSPHPTNEHHNINFPVQTVTPLVNLTPSIKSQGVATPKYNTVSLTGSHLDSNVTDTQRLISILENAPKPVKGKDGVVTTVTRMQVDTVTQTKVANNSQAINATAQELQTTRQTLQAMNNNTNQQFTSLRNEVDNNKKQANAGISGAMAMAGLPQVQTNQHVMFSAGGATYNGESALAVGASVNFDSHVIGKVSFSDDTANNMGASVGIGMGF